MLCLTWFSHILYGIIPVQFTLHYFVPFVFGLRCNLIILCLVMCIDLYAIHIWFCNLLPCLIIL